MASPACRKSVQQVLGDGAEVARALEDQEFIPHFLGVDLAANPKSRQRQRYLAAQRQGRIDLKHRRRRHQVVCHTVLDRRYRDRHRLYVVPLSEQFESERHILRAPDASVRIETDAAVLFGAEFVEARR